MTDEQSHNVPYNKLGSETPTTEDSALFWSQIDPSLQDLVLVQESLWKGLEELKKLDKSGKTLKTRLALQNTYRELAKVSLSLGAEEAAVRFFKNALEQVDDPEIRLELARSQVSTSRYDFIRTYSNLLKDRPYNLRLALEFCYRLETKGLHEAALNTLERELKKRQNLSTFADTSETVTIRKFFVLLQAQISVEQQVLILDYKEIINYNFSEEIVSTLNIFNDTPEEMIVGQAIEEYETNYGLKDELKHYLETFFFFAQDYTRTVLIAISLILLLVLTIFRVSSESIKVISNTFCLILIAFWVFDILQSFRSSKTRILRSITKVSNEAGLTTLAIMLMNWLGSEILREDERFFSPLALKVMSAVLVASVFWRTYLLMLVIQKPLRRLSDSMRDLTRRSFRRQLANIVASTSKWGLFIYFLSCLQVITQGSFLPALYSAIQLLFFIVCWRWGYLEVHAEKQKLRDSFTCIISILFVGLIVIDYYLHLTLWQGIVTLSLDGILLLAILITYVLQIPLIRRVPLAILATCFVFLNFAPVLGKFESNWLRERFFGANLPPQLSLYANLAQAIILLVVLGVVRKLRKTPSMRFVREEVYMESKYKFENNQIGAVGDSASATNFTQVWNASASQIDLPSLANELTDLREKLLLEDKDRSHLTAINEVAMAEKAAKGGDGPVALEHLNTAGAWVWDIATKVGIGVATAAAKQSLGL